MARTEITVTKASPYLAGDDPTATAGDSANDHNIDMTYGPVLLVAVNSNAATVDFTVSINAHAQTFGTTRTPSHTVPAKVGDVDGVRTVWLDLPPGAQWPGGILINSDDVNFGDVNFYAIVGTRTPR